MFTTHVERADKKHAPGDDEWGYEDAGERWLPVHSVETVVSQLSTFEPELELTFAADLCHFPLIGRCPRSQLARKRRCRQRSPRELSLYVQGPDNQALR